jgi:predicted NAD/FAD-binding protein
MKIAVIGTGISGMTVASLLHPEHDLTVFEADDYIGGHSHTVDIQVGGNTYAVDTGFIVFNELNYPNFVKLMKKLGVPWQKSSMSFSVKCLKTGLEYRPSTLNTFFVQRRNLLKPWFWKMIVEIFRFRRESETLLRESGFEPTLGDYLTRGNYSRAFRDYFIIPMGAAIWSADPARFQAVPARFFAQFFKNHGFLNVKNQPQWLTIQGGSRHYVDALTRPFRERIRLNTPVAQVRRHADHVDVLPRGGKAERFDRVVIASHSDQALGILGDPSEEERKVLAALPYQENRTILHTDESVLPRKLPARASWNYHIPKNPQDRVFLTYSMNRLQSIPAPVEVCVTLNPPSGIDPQKVHFQALYHHPVYNPQALRAQKEHERINGVQRTYFCGAYWGNGFHEDGVNSALTVLRHFGKNLE